MAIENRLEETVEYVALRRLQNRYADIVTRRAWPELHEIMLDGCSLELNLGDRTMRLDGPAAIGGFIGAALEEFSFFEFVILNTVMEIDLPADRAGARMYMQELRQDVDGGRRTNAFGVYHDRFERDGGGRWWFARRRYGSFSRTAAVGSAAEQDVFALPVIALGDI